MKLVPIQARFALQIALLPAKALELGIIVTEGESLRPPAMAWLNSLPPKTKIEAHLTDGRIIEYTDTVGGAGILHSTHTEKRGKDFNFFDKDYNPLNHKTPEIVALGKWWESLDARNKWGGNFTPTKNRPEGDMYHFETAAE